jgi:hypothetical protein
MRSFALRQLVGYERSVHRRSDEVLKRILKRSDFDRKPILLAERGTGLVCHNPERGPSATEALRYWPVLAVFVENKEAVFLDHPSQMGLVPMGMQLALGGKVLRFQPR